ncbi:MAG: C69 family dipeptidase [Anaerolineales bacterium]|nr:C69 family dipeptidase [Anaerolineales bacterium]
MCDTMVALKSATADGLTLFAKNSDREPNEAQALVYFPGAVHPAGSKVQCTYREIPQVRETNAVMLSQPYWIWGAEMGANEHGVVIGNEAVFTRVPYDKGPGLIGMDLLRLALERGDTAEAAMHIIIELLEEFGQSGNYSSTHSLYYHNSFLLADADSAWVLETAGKHWAAEKVRDVRAISNAITIGSEWDLASDQLVDFARKKGWCRRGEEFHFGRNYSDFLYTHFADGRSRQKRSCALLEARKGSLTLKDMMAILRDHGEHAGDSFTPVKGLTGAAVCMHAGFGPIRVSQTTGSWAAALDPERTVHWLTGTSTPCTAVFKPVWIEAGLPDTGPKPAGKYDNKSLWWRHEILHREVLRDYAVRLAAFQAERDLLESRFLEEANFYQNMSTGKKLQFSQACFSDGDHIELEWINRIKDRGLETQMPVYHALAWKGFNRKAGL